MGIIVQPRTRLPLPAEREGTGGDATSAWVRGSDGVAGVVVPFPEAFIGEKVVPRTEGICLCESNIPARRENG